MAELARVHNLDVLRKFKHALWKFQETANVALTDAESDLQRTSIWLETEQRTYWNGQLRKRHEAVQKAREKVQEKQLYKDATGHRSSAVDEMKILQAAQRALAEAEQKVAAIKKFIPKMQKQTQMYRGGVQRFASTVQSDLPVAVDRLDQMLATLEAYVSFGSGAPPELATSTASSPQGGSVSVVEPPGGMTRPTPAPTDPRPAANLPTLESSVAPASESHALDEPRKDEG